jgi:competence protein ComGA
VQIEDYGELLVTKAKNFGASDIHLLPKKDQFDIYFRLDGKLHLIQREKSEIIHRLISHFKFLGSMDIGEKRRPQSGTLTLKINDESVFLRLSTLPILNNESLVIRIHPQEKVIPLERLSLFPTERIKLLSLLKHSHGLLLFTGPTGCGKTTTLYALLQAAKENFSRSIITLEDPIEKRTEDIFQVQVNEKAGVTYSSGLRAILRHDPDVIMVGEIRDEETAHIAIRAALSGHLVLTTLHAKDTKGSLYRLLELGVQKEELFQSLVGVVSQRLVPIKCPFCKGECTPQCRSLRKIKRLSVYELLYGKTLRKVMNEINGKDEFYEIKTLNKQFIKGFALGYIDESVLERSLSYE